MKLKHVIPDMTKTFGQLTFAGIGGVVQDWDKGRRTVVARTYNLYSDVQRADDIEVIIPNTVAEKHFEFEDKIELVNPRIIPEGQKIQERGFANYKLYADDIKGVK